LLTIYYGQEKDWSRNRANTKHDGRTIEDRLIQAIQGHFGAEKFLWQGNKSLANPFEGSNAERLPNKPHGLNQYADAHNIAFLSALNPTPDHFRFLQDQGLSSEDVRRAIYYQAAYQSMMRGSLRNPDDTNPKQFIVPELGLAEYLHELFPSSRIERLSMDGWESKKRGRPRKWASDRERKAAKRQIAKTFTKSRYDRLSGNSYRRRMLSIGINGQTFPCNYT